MTMNATTFILLLILKLAHCNLEVPRTNVNGVRDESSSITSLLFVDIEKDAIRRITNSLQQSGQSINNLDRVLSRINGRQTLSNNGGRFEVVPARVDRLRLQSDFSNGVTLLATQPGSNPAETHSDTARFFIPKNVKLPFITPLIHSQPGPFLTPPPRTSSPAHSNNQQSHFQVTNNFSGENNRFVPNTQPTRSPDPIFYFINNPTPFSTHVTSSQFNTEDIITIANVNSRGVLNTQTTSSPNQIFHFVNRPTPSANIPTQSPHVSIGNAEINIPNIRNIIANILANNRAPVQRFDNSNIFSENSVSRDIKHIQHGSTLNVHYPISNTLQPPKRKPSQVVDTQPPSTSTQFNILPPITPLVSNQQIPILNTQPQSNSLNSKHESSTQGPVIQSPLAPARVILPPNNNNPILQQLTPPVLEIPKPEAQVQTPHCLLCDLLTTNNTNTSSTTPNVVQPSSVHSNNNNSGLISNSKKPNVVLQVSSLQPNALRALRLLVDGVLFRADPPDIGVHSTELEGSGLFPHLKRPNEFIMIIPQSMLSMIGNDVNLNLIS